MMPIDSVEDLREHLAVAASVELSTIQLYLFAMYSVMDQDSDAARLIASVVVEEIPHTTLMSRCLAPVARYLVQLPIDRGLHVAPTFEGYVFIGDPWEETSALAHTVARDHSEIAEACCFASGLRPSIRKYVAFSRRRSTVNAQRQPR
jgi:hypothetical protein